MASVSVPDRAVKALKEYKKAMDTSKKKILLVEDEPLIAMSEAMMLRKEGYEVVLAASGEEALAKANAMDSKIALILMDIDLGKDRMDGTQTAQEILTVHDIPILFLSSHTEPEVVAKTEKITSYGYVVKNTGITVLAASIKMAFKLHAAQQTITLVNENLRLAQEASRAGAWDWDIVHNTFHWSPEFLKVFGLPANTVAGFEAWTQAVYPDDREMAGRKIQEAINNHTDLVNDYRIALPDGAIRWIRATGKTYYQNDQPQRMIGLCMDITERKQTEDNLRASEELFRSIQDNSLDRFTILKPVRNDHGEIIDFIYLYQNAMAASLTGRRPEELVGQRMTEIWPAFPSTHFFELYKQVAETGQGTTFEDHYSADGIDEWFRVTVTPIPAGVAIATQIITERKLAEDALREQAQLLDISPLSITVHDENGVFMYANERTFAMHGYTKEEFMSLNLHQLDVPESERLISERMKQIADKGEALFEVRHIHKDGTIFPLEVYVRKAAWFGKPAMLSIAMNISERKRTEEALKASEKRYEQIDSSSRDAIYSYDRQGHFTHANRALCTLLGLSKDQIIGRTHEELGFPQAQCDEWAALHNEVYTTGDTVIRETATPIQGGPVMYFEVILNPVRDAGGTITGISGITRDITERKRAEEDLRRSRDLLDITQRLGWIGGWEWDVERQTMDWTDETFHIHGITPGNPANGSPELITRSLACYDPADRPIIETCFDSCATKGLSYDMEFPLNRIDGSRIWIRTMAMAVKEGDRVVKVIGNIIDITERKRAEGEIKKQLAEKETLLREVHHRIKNNMANVESLLSLQAGSIKSPEAKAVLKDSIARVKSIRILYEKLLLTKDYHDISIKPYAEDLIDSISTVFVMEKKITIKTKIMEFTIDSKKAISLGIIINELLTNAFKYAFKDRDNGIVSISIEKAENSVTLIIKDNGTGFDQKTSSNKSPGLGLTIVKMLVEQLKGTYSVKNENGTKSVIKFEISET